MAYVYRFIDLYGNVSYVGFTGQKLSERMNQHFSDKGHLSKECYSNVAKIEYKKYKTKSDAIVMECYYINKFKSRYNKQSKKNDALTIVIDDNQEWKTYQVLKKQVEQSDPSWGCLTWILIGALAYAVIQLFM